jgi:PAS domain S-box-containing protein
LTWPDGSTHWLEGRGELERDENDKPVLVRGTIIDITDHKLAEKNLRRAQKRLLMHIEKTPLAVMEWDVNFCVTDWNISAEKIFGYSKFEALGKHANELIVPEPMKSLVSDTWAALIESKGGTRSTNENITKDGRIIVCEWHNTPLVKEDGRVIGVASMASDITKNINAQIELAEHRNRLEELVAQRTSELNYAMKEIESFSYSVSHDLRAPLRSINGFSTALFEDYYDLLDETGKEYLTRVINACDRMAHLIDDLLELSRLSRSDMKKEKVNLSSLASYAAGKLQEIEIGRKVDIQIIDNLTVDGDPRLLGVVMDNLIGNAWKYTSKNNLAKIEFGSYKKGNETIYFVKDNGAGFNMRYVNKMFSPFQRLHGNDEFEGTGIGLATVQRLIQRHGGRVWAEGEVDKGATFYFTIDGSIES